MAWEPLPTGRATDPTPLRDALDRVARGLGVSSADALSTLFAGWGDVVGPDVAAHSRPLELRGRGLVVAVDDPAWCTQLRLLEPTVLARIHERVGGATVERLVLRVRPL